MELYALGTAIGIILLIWLAVRLFDNEDDDDDFEDFLIIEP